MPWRQTKGGSKPGCIGSVPEKCDLCGTYMVKLEPAYDTNTRMGPWAWACLDCFTAYGRGLGIGRGQEYRWEEDKPKDPLEDLKKLQAMLTIGAVLYST
jgi:hypothetical protein